MGMITRLVFPLVGYFCVATVISLAAGYGYLLSSGKLDDERMFQIVSLIHDVDLDKIAEEHEADAQDIPPEEPSHQQRQELIQITELHFQAKKDDLEILRREFDDLRRQVEVKMSRFENFKEELKQFLEKRREEALQTGLVGVRKQLETLHPDKQTKELLKKMIEEGRTDVVILILNGMPSKKRTDILKKFDTQEDLSILYKIQKQMLAGHPERTYIDQQIDELEKRSELENN